MAGRSSKKSASSDMHSPASASTRKSAQSAPSTTRPPAKPPSSYYHARPTFSFNLEVIAVVSKHLDKDQAKHAMRGMLGQPIHSQCSRPGCRQQHVRTLHDSRYGKWKLQDAGGPRSSKRERQALNRSNCRAYARAFFIISPVYPCEELSAAGNIISDLQTEEWHEPWFSPEWEISHLTQKLSAFDRHDGISAIYVNPDCSLDVAVGNGYPSMGYTLSTTKNVLNFGIMFARQLDGIANGQENSKGPFDALLSRHTIKKAENFTALNKIARIKSKSISLDDSPRKTFKFVQHTATLDAQEIVAWVHTVTGIVAFCKANSQTTLDDYTRTRWFDLRHTLPDLLQDIGVHPAAVLHYSNVLRRDLPKSYARLCYEIEMAATESHPFQELLHHVITEKFISREGKQAVVMKKILEGQYGWLPAGSPLSSTLWTLPVYDVEDWFSTKTFSNGGVLPKVPENFEPMVHSRSSSGMTTATGMESSEEESGDETMSEVTVYSGKEEECRGCCRARSS